MATTGAAAQAVLRLGAASSRHLFRPSSCQGLLALHKGIPAQNQHASGLSTAGGASTGGASAWLDHECGSLLLQCPDEMGIIAGVSDCLLRHGSNIRATDLHVEKDEDGTNTFVGRISYDHLDSSLESSISDLVAHFGAHASLVLPGGKHVVLDGGTGNPTQRRVLRESGLPRAGIFMSKTEHCLLALLNQVREGDLPLDIRYVVSNHPRDAESSHVQRSLLQLGVDYYYIPHGGRRREDWEADIKEVVGAQGNETDFLVLARYMQILSGSFLSWYGGDAIINIHHGLLPSFKGANPYRQAHNAGVKLIGATAHFVTEDLDEGPIIEQRVARLSHKDDLNTLRMKSENLEAAALQDAVRYFAENRIARVGGRTVVFS